MLTAVATVGGSVFVRIDITGNGQGLDFAPWGMFMIVGYLDPGTGSIVLQMVAGLGCVLSVPALIVFAIRSSAKSAKARAASMMGSSAPVPAGWWYADPTG